MPVDQIFLQRFAVGWSIFAAGYCAAITFVPIAERNIRFADTILGFLLGTIISGIIGYYFGTSLSSAKKDDIIKDQLHGQ